VQTFVAQRFAVPLTATCVALLGIVVTAQPAPRPKLVPLDATGRITYFIGEGVPRSGHQPGDNELAALALKEWERSLGGVLHFEPAASAEDALIRVNWLPPAVRQLAYTANHLEERRATASVFIRPNTERMGGKILHLTQDDPLMRDTIIYALCLHELGHALGLNHTQDSRDVMAGALSRESDIFPRYRSLVTGRDSFATLSLLSEDDIARVRRLYLPPAP
jgi:hypothetical protein